MLTNLNDILYKMEDTKSEYDPSHMSKIYEQRFIHFVRELDLARSDSKANKRLVESLRQQLEKSENQKFHINKENKVLATEIEILKTKLDSITKELSKF